MGRKVKWEQLVQSQGKKTVIRLLMARNYKMRGKI